MGFLKAGVFCSALSLLSLIGFNSAARAQTAFPLPPINNSTYNQFFDKQVNTDYDGSPVDAGSQFAGYTKGDQLENNIAPVDDYSCPSGSCDTGFGSNEQIEPGKRVLPLAAIIPPVHNALVDNLWSTGSSVIFTTAMTATNNVAAATVALTEPAIMAGLHFSYENANLKQSNMLLTDIRAAQVSSFFPSSQELFKTYMHCLDERIKTLGWPYEAAQGFCAADKIAPSSAGPVMGDDGFTFSSHPAYLAADVTDPPNGKLSDIVFNEEIYNGGLPGTPAYPTIEAARDHFVRDFGDIVYEMEVNDKNKFEARYHVQDPVWLPADTYNRKIHERWDRMRIVLYAYCDWYQYQQTAADQNNGPSEDAPKNHWGDLFMPGSPPNGWNLTKQIFKDLSVPGFSFIPQLFDILFKEIREDERLQDCGYYYGDSATVLPYCPFHILGSTCLVPSPPASYLTDRNPYTDLFGGNPTPISKFIRDRVYPRFERKVPALFQQMFFLTRQLALIEFIHEGMAAEALLRHLSSEAGSGITSDKQQEAIKLIYRAVGTKDPVGGLTLARDQLANFVMNAFARMDDENSSAAQSVGEMPNNK